MKIKRDNIEQEIETISTPTIEAIISREEIQCAIHQNVLDKENLVLISIGEPGEYYKYSILSPEEVQGFKDVLQIEFWDVEEDFGKYTVISDEEAKYNYKTCFNSEISAHSRYTPNLTVFDKIVADYNQEVRK